MAYYFLNTNRKNDPNDESDMLLHRKAAAYGTTKHYIRQIDKGDRVFLYSNKNGIIAVGTGSGEQKTKNHNNSKSEEYYTPLNGFTQLSKPLPASRIKAITGVDHRFLKTLIPIKDDNAAKKLWDYIYAYYV